MAKPVGKWTGEQISAARKMLAGGMTPGAVGEHFGVSRDTVLCKIDTEYRLRRNAQNNLNRKTVRNPTTATPGRYYVERVDIGSIEARLAEIPRFDTRDLTGRLMGDPLIERSALARKHLDRET